MAAPPRELGATETHDLLGRQLGRYEIHSFVRAGGRGEVYRAQDTQLKREVAVKRVGPRLRSDPQARSHILKEAQRTSALGSPHIVTVHEVVEFDDELLLVMEFVEGNSLRERMRATGAMPVAQFLDLAVQCAEALATAHRHNIIHRDIKPENIMITGDGLVKVLDFGLAVRVVNAEEETPSITDTPIYAGTPGYMAPEVLLEQEVDARSDIFSLGVVFYEMVSGEHPFRGRKPTAGTMHKTIPGCPSELQRIVSKMLAHEAAERYPTAADLLVDLKALQRGARPTPRWITIFRKWWIWALAAAVLIGAAVFFAFTYRWFHPPPPSFAERDWVLISDFENPAGDPIFDRTLNEALTIALQQSSFVNVLPRERVFAALKRMGRQGVAGVDETTGREVCQRENGRLLLAGSILRSGQAYQIRVRGVDPASGRTLFAEDQRFARKEELFAGVDALTGRIRRRLGESISSIDKSSHALQKVTTKSLEALQLYSRASDDLARDQVESAAARLQAGLVLDPDFAMAHYRLSIVYQILGNRQRETDELGRAYELRDRVSDRERFFIEAGYLGVHGKEQEQTQALKTLVSIYPDDADAHFELAMLHSAFDRSEEAIAELHEVLRLDPNLADAYAALVIRLAYVNATDQALEVYTEAERRGLKTAKLEWGHGMALFGADRLAEARQVFASFDKDPAYGNIGRVYAARVDMYEGKFAAAAARLEHDLLKDVGTGNRSPEVLRRYLLARSYLFLGRARDAKQELKRIEAGGEPRNLQARELRWVGTEYARMGDLAAARRVSARLDALNAGLSDSYAKAAALSLRAEIDLAEGRVAKAVQSYQQALVAMPWAWTQAGLARAYAQQRDWPAARDAWLKVIDGKGQILRHDCSADWVLAHLELARVYRELDDKENAERSYEKFLKLWGHAEQLPLIDSGRRELEQLR